MLTLWSFNIFIFKLKPFKTLSLPLDKSVDRQYFIVTQFCFFLTFMFDSCVIYLKTIQLSKI